MLGAPHSKTQGVTLPDGTLIRAFLVDVGNVLLRLRRDPASCLIPPDKQFPDTAEAFRHLYRQFELGDIDAGTFCKQSIQTIGYEGDCQAFTQDWCDIFSPMYENWHAIEWLHAHGVRLILFSNTNSLHAQKIEEYPILSLFETRIYSHEWHSMKPQKGMYEQAQKILYDWGIEVHQTGYIDDLPANIATGAEMGLRTFLYDVAHQQQATEQFHHFLGIQAHRGHNFSD